MRSPFEIAIGHRLSKEEIVIVGGADWINDPEGVDRDHLEEGRGGSLF